MLGGLAEFERDLIRARTGEGRKRAKARGVKMGRKPRLTSHQQREAIKRRDRGEPIHILPAPSKSPIVVADNSCEPEIPMVGRTVATIVALLLAFYAFYGNALDAGHVFNPFGILCLGFAGLIWFKWDLVRESVHSAKNESDIPIIRLGAKAIQGMIDSQQPPAPLHQSWCSSR
jgi:hypothetical protein